MQHRMLGTAHIQIDGHPRPFLGGIDKELVVLGIDDQQPAQGESNLIAYATQVPKAFGVPVLHVDQFREAFSETYPTAVKKVEDAFDLEQAFRPSTKLERISIRGLTPPPDSWRLFAEVTLGDLKLTAAVRTP